MTLRATLRAIGTALTFTLPLALTPDLRADESVPTDWVELSVQHLFIPEVGYDDNDRIEFVAEGQLPNRCWTVEDKRVEKSSEQPDSGLTHYEVKIWGLRSLQGACAEEDSALPESHRMKVRYTFTVAFPTQLSAGIYHLQYRTEERGFLDRRFEVKPARTPSVDDFDYAPVTAAFIPDTTKFGTFAHVTLTGELASNCSEVSDQPQLERLGDVVVLLPVLKPKLGPCDGTPESFVANVKIPFNLARGRYLLHIRSAHSTSFNLPFSIK